MWENDTTEILARVVTDATKRLQYAAFARWSFGARDSNFSQKAVCRFATTMQASPTIERSVVTPIIDEIAEVTGDVEPLLETTKLLRHWSDSSVSELPEDRVWQLFECAARRNGCPAIGLHAGENLRIEDLGSLGRQLQNSLSLFQCLNKYNKTVSRYSSHASFWLAQQGDVYWFCRQGIDLIDSGRDYVEQFTVQLMIRIVQLASGPNWRPAHVCIQADSANPYRDVPDFDGIEIATAQAVTSIRIPFILGVQELVTDNENPLQRQIEMMLADRSDPYQTSIDDAAKAMGISRRTLQRRLALRGLDWRGLVERFRFHDAIRLTAESDIKLTDLAHELGYTDQANFGRAFRRWTGVSPSSYREMHAKREVRRTGRSN
jgi:AraC-like DNA-binding protein